MNFLPVTKYNSLHGHTPEANPVSHGFHLRGSGMDSACCARKEQAMAEGALEALVKSAQSKEAT